MEGTHSLQQQVSSVENWQVIMRASRQVTDSKITRKEFQALMLSLSKCQKEDIPAEHRNEICECIMTAIKALYLIDVPDLFSEFLDRQLGKEGVLELLQGTEFTLESSNTGIKYYITKAHPSIRIIVEAALCYPLSFSFFRKF